MKLVSVETPEKSVCKMTFSASAEELEAASNAVYARTRATYTIKGFAKGKADRAQIEADRGEHTFWYDAINDLMDKDVPALYDAAMAEHGFHAVDAPVYDLVSVKKDEGFVATATTALQPELNLTQTTGFKTECVTPEVTDKEIAAVLEQFKKRVRVVAEVDSLKHLQKGGRLPAAVALVGGALGIKPVLALKDGEIKLVDTGRGRPGALVAMFKQLDALGGIDPRYGYTLLYSDNKQLIAPVHHYMHQNLQLTGGRVAQLGPTIGTHVGPGVGGVVFVAKE